MHSAIVKFEYPYFGDGDPEVWLAFVLDGAYRENEIMDYASKTKVAKTSTWGVQYVQGRFVMYVEPDVPIGDLFKNARALANKIVNDTDARILKISVR